MTPQEFNAKVEEVSRTLFNYCMRKTSTREDAEDLSQDILLALSRSVSNLQNDEAFWGFMWGVAGNVTREWYRRRERRRTVALTEDIPADEEPYDYEVEEEREEIFRLRRELTLLSDRHRRATVLHYIYRRSVREIAGELGVSESMVKYLLFKSREKLKEGMFMERKLGTLSYAPKTLIPLYIGEGTNFFWDLMQSKPRQNILMACYNDALTPAGISLETGIPLPYLEDDIAVLVDKKVLLPDGSRLKTNVVLILEECRRAMDEIITPCGEQLSACMKQYIEDHLADLRAIGFVGADFSENTLRWQFMAELQRSLLDLNNAEMWANMPLDAWGGHSILWCVETYGGLFNYCTLDSRCGDEVLFCDYLPHPCGDHHHLFGNERKVNILCDIARGERTTLADFGTYDLDAVAELIRDGYVLHPDENAPLTPALPVYTTAQYAAVRALAEGFMQTEAAAVSAACLSDVAEVLRTYTPAHLHGQIDGVVRIDGTEGLVGSVVSRLIAAGFLSTAWTPGEMPGTRIVIAC